MGSADRKGFGYGEELDFVHSRTQRCPNMSNEDILQAFTRVRWWI